MSNIDRLPANSDAARTYVQSADAARTAAAQGNAQHTAKNAHHAAHAKAADSVELSDAARSLAAARQAVDAAPDVRSDKVDAIKKQVSDGTYQVSAQVLAQKMLKSHE